MRQNNGGEEGRKMSKTRSLAMRPNDFTVVHYITGFNFASTTPTTTSTRGIKPA